MCFCRYIIQKQKDPDKAHQIKLDTIIKALKWLGIDMDMDEVYINFVCSFFIYFKLVMIVFKSVANNVFS